MKKKDSTHMFLSNEKIQSLSILTNIRLNRFLQRLWSYFSWRIYVLILAGLFYLYSHETTTWFLIYTVPPILGIWTATLALNNNISLRFEAFIQSLTESNPSRSSKNSHDRDHENEFKSVKLNPAAQAELNKLINYICRDFISTWYKNLSQSDHFEKETRKKLEQICSHLIDRIGNIDPHLFIQHLCGILTNHFHIYHECVKGFTHRASSNRSTPPPTAPPLSHQDSNDGSNRKDQEELIWQSYKARCSYQGITATQDGEQDYIRHMATLLLYALLSSDEFNSDTVRYLLREILASHILQSIIRSLSEPRIINRLLGKLIERVFTAYARRQAKSVKLAQLRQKKKNRPPNITVNQSNTLNQPINSNSVHDSSEYLSDVSNDSNTTKVINKQSAHGPGKDRSEKQGISNKGNNIRPRANTHTAAVQVPSQGNSSLSTKPIDEETNSIEVFANRNKAVHKNKNKLTLSKKLFKRVQPRFRLGSDETENSEKGTDDHNGNNTSNIQDENEEDEFAQSTATGLGNNAKRTHKSKRISKIYSSLIRDRSVQSNHRKTATFDGSSSYRSTHANENIPSKATRSHSYDDIDCVKKENENSFLKAFHKIKTISGKEDNHHNLTSSKDTILNLDFADKSTNGMKDLFNPLPQHQQIKDRTGIQIYVTSPAGHQRSNDDIFQEENQPDDVSLHFNPINKLEKLGFYKPISIPKTITAKDKTGNKYTLYCIEYYDSIWRNVEQHEESKSRNTFSLRAKKRQRIKSDESEKVADRHSLSLSKKNQCKDDIVDVIGSKNAPSNGSFPFKVKKLFDVRLKRSRWQHTGSFVLDVADSENTDDIVYSLGHREIHHRFSEFFALNRRLRRRFSPADLKGLSLSGTRLVHAFSRFDPAVIENRRDMLECYLKVLISRPRLRNSVEFQQFMGRLADENLIFPQPLFGEDIDPEDLDSGESKDVTIETKEKGDNSGETSTTTKVTYSNYRTFTFREPQNKSFKIKIPSIAYFSVYIYNKEQERQQSKKKTKVFTKSSSLLDLRKVVPSTQRGSFMVPNSSWNGNSIPLIDSNGHLPGSTGNRLTVPNFNREVLSRSRQDLRAKNNKNTGEEMDIHESVASNRKTPILRLQMTNESLAVHYPLTDTILLLLCQLLQPHDSVFCVSTVQQALLSFFGKNIENVISSGIKEFLRNFGWDYYFNYLHTFLWPEGIWLANASSNSTIDDEGEIRKNTEEWMTKGCNSLFSYLLNEDQSRITAENIVLCFQNRKINRYVVLKLLDAIMSMIVTEAEDKDFQRHFLNLQFQSLRIKY